MGALRNSSRGARSCSRTPAGCPGAEERQDRELSKAQSRPRARPRPLPSPFSAQWLPEGPPQPASPASAALPSAQLPLPPIPTGRGGSQGQQRAAWPKLPTFMISSRLELQLQGACSPSSPPRPVAHGLHRAGIVGRGEDRTHLEPPNRGHCFFTLSPPSWEDVTTPAPPFPASSAPTSHPGSGVPWQPWRL